MHAFSNQLHGRELEFRECEYQLLEVVATQIDLHLILECLDDFKFDTLEIDSICATYIERVREQSSLRMLCTYVSALQRPEIQVEPPVQT